MIKQIIIILKYEKEKKNEENKSKLKDILKNNDKIIGYGSYFTGLTTEFSDMDIQILRHDCLPDLKYGEDLKNDLKNLILKDNIKNFKIRFISNTKKGTPPVIKLKYDVSNEIDLNKINFSLKYLDGKEDELTKINIDITFTNKKKEFKKTKNVRKIIKESLIKNKQLKPVILYSKIYFKKQGIYSTLKGGINSISLYSFPRNIFAMYEKKHISTDSFSNLKILRETSKKFGHYNYLYGIDKDGYDYTLENEEKQIIKEQKHRRFVIKNPADESKNIASGCFETGQIMKAFSLLNKHINKGKDIFLPLQEVIVPVKKK